MNAARLTPFALALAALGSLVAWRLESPRPTALQQTRDQLVDHLPARTEIATFGAGCFWRVEGAFRKLPGVVATSAGYAGGTTDRPAYQQVCLGNTGHAEVVRITFDPSVISYERLLEAFWSCHDPTSPHDPEEPH